MKHRGETQKPKQFLILITKVVPKCHWIPPQIMDNKSSCVLRQHSSPQLRTSLFCSELRNQTIPHYSCTNLCVSTETKQALRHRDSICLIQESLHIPGISHDCIQPFTSTLLKVSWRDSPCLDHIHLKTPPLYCSYLEKVTHRKTFRLREGI